jgi:hypothetical protein
MPRALVVALVLASAACTGPRSRAELPASALLPTADEPVAIAVRMDPRRIAPGGEGLLTVQLATAPAWHLAPPDAADGGGLRVSLAAPAGTEAGAFTRPQLRPSPQDGTPVLAGDFTMSCPLRILPDAAPGPRRLRIEVDYVACDPFRCLPPAHRVFEVELEVR